MRYFLSLCVLSIFTNVSLLHAQKRASKKPFHAGIILGINTSQINGDLYSGYDKFGVFLGFRALAKLSTKSEFVIEMQYNTKGSKNPEQFVPGQNARRFIALDYIEVPILYHRKVETSTGIFSIEAGIAYARLIGTRINENENSINYSSFAALTDEFEKDEFALIIGGGVFLKEHIRLMGRISNSITPFYENKTPVNNFSNSIPVINKLRNIQLLFGVNYIF